MFIPCFCFTPFQAGKAAGQKCCIIFCPVEAWLLIELCLGSYFDSCCLFYCFSMVGIAMKMRGNKNWLNPSPRLSPFPAVQLSSVIAGQPPLASSETLFSHSMVNIDTGFQMMTWDQFSKLDPECKSAEIQRLLPLVSFMTEDVSSIQRDVTVVENRLLEIRWQDDFIFREICDYD